MHATGRSRHESAELCLQFKSEKLGRRFTIPKNIIPVCGDTSKKKTGCIITANGENDDKITPEGLPDYKIPASALYLPPPEEPEVCEVPTPSLPEPDVATVENETFERKEDDEREDIEADRDFEHVDIGRQVKALYETGWHTGVVRYFNRRLREYKVDSCD